MSKLYVVSSGKYEDYYIERIFETLLEAELYCAEESDKRRNKKWEDMPEITIWETDRVNDMTKTLFRAIWFVCYDSTARGSVIVWSMGYSLLPFHLDIQKDREIDEFTTIHGISGYIPIAVSYDTGCFDDIEQVHEIIKKYVTEWEEEHKDELGV